MNKPKAKKKSNKGKKYEKPISFYPLKFEDAVRAILETDPKGIVKSREKKKKGKTERKEGK